MDDLAEQRSLKPVGDMAGHLLMEPDRPLAEPAVEFRDTVDGLLGRLRAADDLDQRDQVRRIEGMPDHTPLGVARACRLDLADGQARRTRRDDGIRREDLVEMHVEISLKFDPFRPVLLHQVGVRNRRIEVVGES